MNIHKRSRRKKRLTRKRRKVKKFNKRMEKISTFFKEDEKTYKKSGIIVFDFDDSKSNEFIENFIIPFRKSYIADEILDLEVRSGVNKREEAISNRLPEKANLKSGEFSEILVFFLALKFICPDANIRPIKWRWKENKDQPCHLTDIVLMRCNDENNPQTTDYIFSSEIKSAATPIGDKSTASRMNEAIEGALKDKSSRIGKMIAYLTTQYIRDRKSAEARAVKRFDDSTTVSYERRISAIVVSERESLKNHVKNISIENQHKVTNENIALFAIPIKNLKNIYEQLYAIIPTKG